LLDRFRNHTCDAFDIVQDVTIPKSQHAVAMASKIAVAFLVTARLFIFSMLAAIQFNDELPPV
jgi:hypothetical protein